jgi:hypothetical protein
MWIEQSRVVLTISRTAVTILFFSLHLQFRKPNNYNKKGPEASYRVNNGYRYDTDDANSQVSDTTPDVVVQIPVSDNQR